MYKETWKIVTKLINRYLLKVGILINGHLYRVRTWMMELSCKILEWFLEYSSICELYSKQNGNKFWSSYVKNDLDKLKNKIRKYFINKIVFLSDIQDAYFWCSSNCTYTSFMDISFYNSIEYVLILYLKKIRTSLPKNTKKGTYKYEIFVYTKYNIIGRLELGKLFIGTNFYICLHFIYIFILFSIEIPIKKNPHCHIIWYTIS